MPPTSTSRRSCRRGTGPTRGRTSRPCRSRSRTRYFELQDGRYVFRPDVRRAVIFGRHDLVRDPPISRVDLLLARNTLMYFNPELQARILGSFHFALNDAGFLFLGKSEMLLTRTKLFVPVDLKRRVFEKIDGGTERPPRLLPAAADAPPRPAARPRRAAAGGIRGDPRRGLRDRRGRDARAGEPARASALPAHPGRPRAARSRISRSRTGRSTSAPASTRWNVGSSR